MAIPTLEFAAVGRPITRLGVSFFPVYLPPADLFATPDLLRPHWPALVRSHLLERPTSDGHHSAGRALRFIGRLAGAPSERREGLGHGIEHHVRTDRIVGQALVLPTACIHAAAFAR